MAVPFRRKSSTRVRKGRSPKNLEYKTRNLNIPLIKCNEENCEGIKVLHKICPSCLSYKGISFGKKTEKKES
jgi:ribosomal protein L32